MDNATQTLLQMGLPGVVIIGLSWTCHLLYRRVIELQADLVREMKDALMRTHDVVDRNTAALEKQTTLVETLIDLQRGRH